MIATRRRPLWIALVLSVVACGSSSTKPESTPDSAVATAARASASVSTGEATGGSSSKDSPRRAKAKQIVRVSNDPEGAADAEQKARIAAVGLGEADFGLPAGQLKALHAVSSNDVDPSQCSTILGLSLDETAKPAVEKRCGSFDALKQKLAKVPVSEKASLVATTCKIATSDSKALAKENAWAVLLSAVVADELASDPATSDDERTIALALAHLCPSP